MELYVTYGITAIFGLAVLGKLTGKTKPTFDKAGYGPALMYGVAVAEVILVIGLFTGFKTYACIGLLVILTGAAFTLFRQRAKAVQYLFSAAAAGLLLALLFNQF